MMGFAKDAAHELRDVRRSGRDRLVREVSGQVVLRYEANPNGSVADIAGVANEKKNVFGLMPHPEHAVDPLLGSTDGALILGSLVDSARERLLTAA